MEQLATPSNPGRRTILKAAAWSTPAIALAVAAPAASASVGGMFVVQLFVTADLAYGNDTVSLRPSVIDGQEISLFTWSYQIVNPEGEGEPPAWRPMFSISNIELTIRTLGATVSDEVPTQMDQIVGALPAQWEEGQPSDAENTRTWRYNGNLPTMLASTDTMLVNGSTDGAGVEMPTFTYSRSPESQDETPVQFNIIFKADVQALNRDEIEELPGSFIPDGIPLFAPVNSNDKRLPISLLS